MYVPVLDTNIAAVCEHLSIHTTLQCTGQSTPREFCSRGLIVCHIFNHFVLFESKIRPTRPASNFNKNARIIRVLFEFKTRKKIKGLYHRVSFKFVRSKSNRTFCNKRCNIPNNTVRKYTRVRRLKVVISYATDLKSA